jgi:hypothetical protein
LFNRVPLAARCPSSRTCQSAPPCPPSSNVKLDARPTCSATTAYPSCPLLLCGDLQPLAYTCVPDSSHTRSRNRITPWPAVGFWPCHLGHTDASPLWKHTTTSTSAYTSYRLLRLLRLYTVRCSFQIPHAWPQSSVLETCFRRIWPNRQQHNQWAIATAGTLRYIAPRSTLSCSTDNHHGAHIQRLPQLFAHLWLQELQNASLHPR